MLKMKTLDLSGVILVLLFNSPFLPLAFPLSVNGDETYSNDDTISQLISDTAAAQTDRQTGGDALGRLRVSRVQVSLPLLRT